MKRRVFIERHSSQYGGWCCFHLFYSHYTKLPPLYLDRSACLLEYVFEADLSNLIYRDIYSKSVDSQFIVLSAIKKSMMIVLLEIVRVCQ